MEEKRLLSRLRERDPALFEDLIGQYGKLVWTVTAGILRGCGSREDVEECVSDVFTALWEHPERYDPGRGELRTYLCLLARSRALDRLRGLVRSPLPLEEGESEEDPQEIVLRREQLLAADRALRKMESPVGELLRLRLLYGLRPRELAAKFSLPVETVYELLRRGKDLLRRQLSEEEWR